MKNLTFLIVGLLLIGQFTATGQALVDIESSNSGLLIPRLDLVSTTSPSPLVSHEKGMIIYNNASVADVLPGLYVNDGVMWIAQLGPADSLVGLWERDTAMNLIFLKTLSDGETARTVDERIHVTDDGYLGLGVANAESRLHIKGHLTVEGNTISKFFNSKSAGRDYLGIRANTDASGADSDGSGVNIYADDDSGGNPGGITFFADGKAPFELKKNGNVWFSEMLELKGDAIRIATIEKNNTSGRDELQIYASGDAYSTNSAGSGIHLYGNSDDEHAGNIAFLTGNSNAGNARMIIAGGGGIGAHNRNLTETRITVGNNLWNFVDDKLEKGLFNIKSSSDIPAIFITGTDSLAGAIAVPIDEELTFGHWDDLSGSLIPRFSLIEGGGLRISGETESLINNSSTSGREILEIRAKMSNAEGGGVNLYGDGDSGSNAHGVSLFTGGVETVRVTKDKAMFFAETTLVPTAISNKAALYCYNDELRALDGFGNHTVISPHRFELMEPSENMAWSFYSKNELQNRVINVDMLKLSRLVESISGQKLVHMQDLNGKQIETDLNQGQIEQLTSANERLTERIEELERIVKELYDLHN